MNYYGINEKYEAIKEMVEQEAMENGGAVEDVLLEALDSAELAKEDAVFGLMYDIKNSDSELGKLNGVMSELKEKEKLLKLRIDSRKRLLAHIAGKESYSDGVVSTTKAVSVSLVVTGDIPEEYVTTESVTKEVSKVDKKSIKDQLQGGAEYEWAHLDYKKSVK